MEFPIITEKQSEFSSGCTLHFTILHIHSNINICAPRYVFLASHLVSSRVYYLSMWYFEMVCETNMSRVPYRQCMNIRKMIMIIIFIIFPLEEMYLCMKMMIMMITRYTLISNGMSLCWLNDLISEKFLLLLLRVLSPIHFFIKFCAIIVIMWMKNELGIVSRGFSAEKINDMIWFYVYDVVKFGQRISFVSAIR